MIERPSVVFMGSGPVAAESLTLLLDWCDIEAVITKPQPPHHKQKFPVIAVAEAHRLPLRTVSSKAAVDALVTGESFVSRLGILIDFGIIVSQRAIDSFELGIINSHFSVLPEWRGADPISFAILSGQAQTGVSLMRLVAAMDEGPLIGYGEYDLPADCTTPQLTKHLIQLSDALLQHDVPRLLSGEAVGVPQVTTGRQVSYSRKLSKDDGLLDFATPAVQLERQVRAYIDWPKSRTRLAGKDVVITKARAVAFEARSSAPLSETTHGEPGSVRAADDKGSIIIDTSDGLFCVERLKPAGKPEMSAQAFLAGNQL